MEELFEARVPKYLAQVAPFDGKVASIEHMNAYLDVTIEATNLELREYYLLDETMIPTIKKGDTVEEKQIVARSKETRQKIQVTKAGIVMKIDNGVISVRDLNPEVVTYQVPHGRNVLVKEGDAVKTGMKLTEGHIDIHTLMDVAGPLKTQLYIVNDIKEIYSSQGQTVNAKHIELIVRQMFSKVKITNAGDSSFFPGDIVDVIRFKKENRVLAKTGEKEAIGTQLLLGLTKISLFTESWLSAASFQETVRVLVEASVSRKIDHLDGLKENVIIGRLIPTLKYFENNRNVGEFFAHEHDGDEDMNHQHEFIEMNTESTSLV
mgnify:CR=1 FL=1